MLVHYSIGERRFALEVHANGRDYAVKLGGQPLEVAVLAATPSHLDLRVEGRRCRAWIAPQDDAVHVFLAGRAYVLRRHTGDEEETDARDAAGPHVRAPMPGKVVKLLASPGDQVVKGQTLLILEAMKMETEIAAPLAGSVAAVHVVPGQIVGLDQSLVDLEPVVDAAQGNHAAR